jgi:hypothetical protein
MTRNEQQMYSDISSIAKSLKKIASVLEHMNHDSYIAKQEIPKFPKIDNDVPYVYSNYLHQLVQNLDSNAYLEFCNAHCLPSNDAVAVTNYIADLDYDECLGIISDLEAQPENDIPCKIDGIINDSDYRVRLVASNYEDDYATKKDAILDYVESEFGADGARYTDVIKFAYYLGAPNAPKYTSENRGYYSCAFSSRMNGHLIQGGEDFLVKGINKNGKERYFTHSSVNKFTDYYKRID